MRHPALFLGLAVALLAPAATLAQDAAAPAAATSTAPAPPKVEPEAVAALSKMGNYLRSLKEFTVHGDTAIDLVTEDDQKLQFPGTVDYKVRAPDGLQLDVQSANRHRQLFFDGKQVTIWSPDTKFYATADAPGTIRDLLARAEDKYGITLPLADLFLWGTDKAPVSALTDARRVGEGRIGDCECEHYAFRQPGVDWQIWIQPGDQPLPRRFVITTKDDPTEPQYESTMTWNTNASLPASAFTFTPGRDAKPIRLVELGVASTNSPEATP